MYKVAKGANVFYKALIDVLKRRKNRLDFGRQSATFGLDPLLLTQAPTQQARPHAVV